MADPDQEDARDGRGSMALPRISRRGFLIGGGTAAGLFVAWNLWPREYVANPITAEEESAFSAWLKIGKDGQVVVFVPQSEMGQGVFTLLPQIVAGELGADWRTVGVQPAQANALFANDLLAREWAPALLPNDASDTIRATAGQWAIDELARRNLFMVTAGSSSVRAFEGKCREAGAAARVLLCKAAAEKWDIDWQQCRAEDGFVISGKQRLSFAELAEAAAYHEVPDEIPLRPSPVNRLSGKDLPRLDLPTKVDGSASFAGDIRLTDMLFAAIAHAPLGAYRLSGIDEEKAKNVPGYVAMARTSEWIAAVATNWWAADRALTAMRPGFAKRDPDAAQPVPVGTALRDALYAKAGSEPGRLVTRGNPAARFDKDAGTRVLEAEYQVSAAVHAPVETRSATAHFRDGRLELWLATQSPQAARQSAADALSIAVEDVVLYPMMAGGSFGRNLDNRIAAEVAIIAREVGRPVQLIWSREDDLRLHPVRAPAMAKLTGAVDTEGQLAALATRIAVPSTAREQMYRLVYDEGPNMARRETAGEVDPLAVEGAEPPYAIPDFTLDHRPVDIGVPTGRWRGNGHSYTAFFTESFVDELAALAGVEPLSFRMQMLSGQLRLANCLKGVAEMADWDGGVDQSGMGLACHSMRGSHIAVIVKARTGDRGIEVDSIWAKVDCGRIVHPEIARQQIEGGLIFGMAQALGSATDYRNGQPTVRSLADLDLPRLSDVGEVRVEFIRSEEPPGGIGELGVPPVAPAIANALYSASGRRLRSLPLLAAVREDRAKAQAAETAKQAKTEQDAKPDD